MIGETPNATLSLADLTTYLRGWLEDPVPESFELVGGPGAILRVAQHPVSKLVRLYVHSRNGRKPAVEALDVFEAARSVAKDHWADTLYYVDRDGHGTTWIFFYAPGGEA